MLYLRVLRDLLETGRVARLPTRTSRGHLPPSRQDLDPIQLSSLIVHPTAFLLDRTLRSHRTTHQKGILPTSVAMRDAMGASREKVETNLGRVKTTVAETTEIDEIKLLVTFRLVLGEETKIAVAAGIREVVSVEVTVVAITQQELELPRRMVLSPR